VYTSNNNSLVDNLVDGNANWGIRTYWESAGVGTGNHAWNNLVWANASGAFWFPGGGLDQTGSILADPLLVGGGNYHLSSGSPAIGVAAPSYSTPTDYDGRSRSSTAPDLGAFEP